MAGEAQVTPWPVETIPDVDRLYMRVHYGWHKKTGEIGTGAFQNRGAGLSTDWSRYSSPSQTRGRHKDPGSNAVVELIVADVRLIPGQSVIHTPLAENRAYAEVFGEKDEEARVKLRRICRIVIGFDDPVA